MSTVEDSFQIFIALPTNDVCTVKGLSREMFVYELKSKVELKAGIPGDIFNLFFMNAQLLDKETLKSYKLKHGCIVRVKMEPNWISLFEACWRGDIFVVFENGVQFLEEEKFQGYNISLWNKLVIQRATFALFIACHRGYLGLILELINRGATDINGKTIFGRSALHVAAYQGFVGCVSLLLSEGAICNQIDIQGKTPLALASENGHVYCERRLWLYQWNLQTFRQPPQSWSTGTSESNKSEGRTNGRYSPQGAKLPSSRRAHEKPDQNNNSNSDNNNNSNSSKNQQSKAIHLHLPRVTNNDDMRQLRRAQSYEAPRSSSPLPLMQIAEKYRKELREYNEGTLKLPDKESKKGLKEEGERTEKGSEVPHLAISPKDGVEVVEEANSVGELEKGLERPSARSEEPAEELSKEENEESKMSSHHTGDQAQDNRNTEDTAKLQDQERPASGKTSGIRKLDIVMCESRVERLKTVFSSREQDKLYADRSESDEKELEQEQGSALIDLRQEYCCRKPAQTFETWLQMKRSQEKTRPRTAPVQKSRLGKSIDPESFKKWLNSKRHQRTHSNSESASSNRKTFISSGGLTFDRWLETKLTNRPFSAVTNVTETRDTASVPGNKIRKQVISGKPFELWLAEKKMMEQSIHDGVENSEQNNNISRSGKTFQVWLQEKNKQKQIELVQKITTEKEQQRLAELDQLQKWLNPHYKTYEDWLAIKNQQAMLERVRTQNEPENQEEDIPAEEKQKDAKVVYNIWQTMKALQELSDEERKYKEMKAKWAAKEKEKEQLRGLNIINKAKKYHLKSTSAKS